MRTWQGEANYLSYTGYRFCVLFHLGIFQETNSENDNDSARLVIAM